MIDYTKILLVNYPGAVWNLDGDEYEGLDWLSDTPKPSKEELDAQWEDVLSKLEQEKNAQVIKREAALAKLEALGLEPDDLKALGL